MVPLAAGRFDLDDYVDYLIEMLHVLGGNMHVVAVCQPSVPVVAAVSIMEAENDPFVPISMTLMGGPIDTRHNPTAVNNLAAERGIDWFRNHVITKVPFPHPGVMRDVYPGFLQLNGFISMNLDRHMDAHKELFRNLVKGDGDLVDKHRDFYDEYLAVMDLSAEYYLQTVDTVFVKHALPKGEMTHRGKPVDPSKVRRVALMTVEGENDDISGLGQTEATHDFVQFDPQSSPRALCAKGRRSLRSLQRLAFQIGNRATHSRFHGVGSEREALARLRRGVTASTASKFARNIAFRRIRHQPGGL